MAPYGSANPTAQALPLRNTGGVEASHRTERGFDRLVNFSDAIVAIAITLLVLPLMDLQTDDTQNTWQLLAANSGVFFSMVITFLVIAIMWLAHHRVFEFVADYDQGLIWLNFLWLLLIVVMPFMSGELTRMSQGSDASGTVTTYCLVMAGLSGALALIVWYLQKHPQLIAPHASPTDISGVRSWSFFVYLLLLAFLAIWFPDAAAYGLMGLYFVGLFSQRWMEARTRRSASEAPPEPESAAASADSD